MESTTLGDGRYPVARGSVYDTRQYTASGSSEYSSGSTIQYTPTSSSGYAPSAVDTPRHRTITTPALQRHDTHQAYLHRNPTHVAKAQHDHHRRLRAAAASIDARLPHHFQEKAEESQSGMTPYERFGASSEYPQQRYCSYQPVDKSASYCRQRNSGSQCATTARRTSSSVMTQPSSSVAGYSTGREISYSYYQPRTLPPGRSLTDWGYDLAGVGALFGGCAGSQQKFKPYERRSAYARQ